MSQAAQISTPLTLVINRTFRAPRERVFKAWTDPKDLEGWFAPSDDFTTVASADLRVGGTYRIEMRKNDGSSFILVGTYQEIKAPERLKYTWKWENAPDAEETLVTVEFRSAGGTTEVIVTHENFRDENVRDRHAHGWDGCFDRMARYLSKAQGS